MKENKIIKEFNMSGPCIVDIDELNKVWDYRFVLSDYNGEYRLIKYLRRGSGTTEMKCTISKEQALEIIDLLKLVETRDVIFKLAATWRKVGFSELDMRRKPKLK